MDVRTVVMDYLASIKHLSKNTQVGYRQRLTVFAEWAALQGVSLEQVNNRNVQRFLDWLSSHTIADYVRNIWTFLYWCIEDQDFPWKVFHIVGSIALVILGAVIHVPPFTLDLLCLLLFAKYD